MDSTNPIEVWWAVLDGELRRGASVDAAMTAAERVLEFHLDKFKFTKTTENK